MAVPSILVAKVGGSTFIDTTDPTKVDCQLGDIEYRANDPTQTTLTVPVLKTALCGELLSSDLEVDDTAVIEVTIAGNLLPRFVLSGARLTSDLNAVEFKLSDRRYELTRRYVGRTGPSINLTPEFYDAVGLPAGWTINPGAPDTVSVAPYGSPGVVGTRAMVLSATGPGPGNSVSAGVNLSTETYDRSIGFGLWIYLASGSWAPNLDGQLVQIVAYDTASGLIKDSQVANIVVSDTYAIGIGAIRVPAGETWSIEYRLTAPDGDVRLEDPALELTESLSWDSEDAATILVDLVTHASDSTWGHSSTGLTADGTSIPSTGIVLSRAIASAEKQQVSSAVTEMCNVGQLWQRVVPGVSTDKLYADTDGSNPGVSATPSNSNLGPWEWAGENHTGVLGAFAPDNIDLAGSRLVMWIAAGGLLSDRGAAWDLGREQYMPGPYGSYDPRVVSNLLSPFFAAKQAALTVPLEFGYDSTVVGKVADGSLRPGCSLPVNVGTWPAGVNDTFRVVNVTLDTQSWHVRVDLNREL